MFDADRRLSRVFLVGTTVSRATSTRISSRKKICIGSRVIIRKAGEIIPEVVSVVSEPEDTVPYRLPETCPSCGELSRVWRKQRRCTNPQCPAQLMRNLIHLRRASDGH